ARKSCVSPSSASRASSLETRGVNGPERQTPPFNRQTPSTRFRPKAGDDAARPRASAVPKNHQNAPPTDAETSRRCIMQAKDVLGRLPVLKNQREPWRLWRLIAKKGGRVPPCFIPKMDVNDRLNCHVSMIVDEFRPLKFGGFWRIS